tara:strand:- start:1463 stop:1987 length:525 start_codon:yes stop_codon:yes gene_type:complete
MILILDNFLSLMECKDLIKIYKQNKHLAHRWPPQNRDTRDLISLSKEYKLYATGPASYPINLKKLSHPLVADVVDRMSSRAHQYFGSKVTMGWGELKKHEKGSIHPLHLDTSNVNLASIIYLHSLTSGHTFFEDGTQVTPRAGRIIFFHGKKYKHGMTIPQKDRYTIPVWWTLP